MKHIKITTKRTRAITPYCTLLATVFYLATLLSPQLVAQVQNTSEVYQSADRPRALALIGDRYHSPVHVRNGLMGPLALENIPVVYIENHEALTAEVLKEFDLLIFLKDGNI